LSLKVLRVFGELGENLADRILREQIFFFGTGDPVVFVGLSKIFKPGVFGDRSEKILQTVEVLAKAFQTI